MHRLKDLLLLCARVCYAHKCAVYLNGIYFFFKYIRTERCSFFPINFTLYRRKKFRISFDRKNAVDRRRRITIETNNTIITLATHTRTRLSQISSEKQWNLETNHQTSHHSCTLYRYLQKCSVTVIVHRLRPSRAVRLKRASGSIVDISKIVKKKKKKA